MKTIFVTIFVILVFFANSLYSQNWYTIYGSNQKNGLTKLTGPVSVSNTYWTANTISAVQGMGTFTFGDKFVTTRYNLYPLPARARVEMRSLTNGDLLWSKLLNDSSTLMVVGFNEDAVYACDYTTHTFYALKTSNGDIKWSCPSEMYPNNEGICFADDGDPILQGKRLNRLTGVPKWVNNYSIPVGPNGGFAISKNFSTYYHWTGAINTPKKLIAIDMETGQIKYQSGDLPGDADQENDLVIGPDGTIYMTRDGDLGSLYAFTDNGSGFSVKWQMTPGRVIKSFGPNNVIYAINTNNGPWWGNLMRIDGNSGVIIDTVSPTVPAACYVSVDYDSTVYVSPLNSTPISNTYAFTPDLNTIKWQLNTPNINYSGVPIGKDGVLIITDAYSQIRAYKQNVNRKPVADFRSSGRDISLVSQNTVNFIDQSSYAPTSWQWTFEGGTPSTSTQQNPSNITYSATGIYSVKLVASNSYGSDTIIRNKYVFVTTTTGITSNEENAAEYKLEQNYPNPFNPSTNIKFNMPKTGNARISVYDINGKEVTVLVNGLIKAGDHTIKFNAEYIPSGVYFYKLTAGDFIQTKKMLLLK